MRRTQIITVLAGAVAALALVPASAGAKELQAMSICGPQACADVPRDQLSIHLLEGGATTPAPDRSEPWYRVRVTVGAPGTHESWQIVVLPRGRYVANFAAGPGSALDWTTISAGIADRYRRLAGGVRPFPAAKLPLRSAAPATPSAVAPAAAPADDSAGAHPVAMAGAVAGVVLLAAGAWSLRRRGARER
jgi:hypothetical protein